MSRTSEEQCPICGCGWVMHESVKQSKTMTMMRHRKAVLDEALAVCNSYLTILDGHMDQDGNITGPDFNFSEILAVTWVRDRIALLKQALPDSTTKDKS